MTDIAGITTTDKVRSAWGVVSVEAPDTMLDNLDLADQLTLDLSRRGLDYATIKSEGTAASPTDAQKNKWYALKLYSTYFCAAACEPTMLLAAKSAVSDGNNEMKRHGQQSLLQTAETIKQQAENYLNTLLDLLDSADAATAPVVAVKVTPTFDPVTG